jgi:hypothetical protein
VVSANVGIRHDTFIANFDDGRSFEASDMYALAKVLVSSGISVQRVGYEWRAGQRMMTAGQQVALAAEMRFLLVEATEFSVAA